MNSLSTSIAICASLFAALFVGGRLRRYLPAHHLAAESRDGIRNAMGMVVTMSALLLGLLVASAKSSFDTKQSEITQISGKIVFLERMLTAYGPEADPARAAFRQGVEAVVHDLWSSDGNHDRSAHATYYLQIQQLEPHTDFQRLIKSQAISISIDLGQLRALVDAQAQPSVSRTMLAIVVAWLIVIFASFSLLSPGNATTTVAFLLAAISVAAAMFLILELDRPFTGLIQIPSQPVLDALNYGAQ